MNKVTISGNLTKDPEMYVDSNGDHVCGFTLAVDRWNQENTGPDYFRISVWGKKAENCMAHLHKGDKALVCGTVRLSLYMDGNTGKQAAMMAVNAQEVEFINK